MSDTPGNAELWLPSAFLAEDNLGESPPKTELATDPLSDICFPSEFPYEYGSSSAESDSDDDGVSGLTRKFFRSTVREVRMITNLPPDLPAQKKRVYSGSPQSTLSGVGSWSFSSDGSSVSASRLPTPPTTPVLPDEDAWNLISAASDQVARITTGPNNDIPSRNTVFLLRRPPPTRPPFQSPLNYSFRGAKDEQTWDKRDIDRSVPLHQVSPNGVKWGVDYGSYGGSKAGLTQSLLPLHVQSQGYLSRQHPNSLSARVPVFLGGYVAGGVAGGVGTRRACTGTGVFLPRRHDRVSDQTKLGSAAVPPQGVVQARNNFDPFPAARSCLSFTGAFVPNYGELDIPRNILLPRHPGSKPSREGLLDRRKACLPLEWTY